MRTTNDAKVSRTKTTNEATIRDIAVPVMTADVEIEIARKRNPIAIAIRNSDTHLKVSFLNLPIFSPIIGSPF
jgi:hypothetical protein